ncbi:MAG TPA: cysteine--tRNA ligase [Patescibacteria group bacterium]|nr:cysteine--tRNA ligase [Patescibacteria group bacterium]
MPLHLYNTLTRQKEEFKPLEPKQVKLYCCGPTVYNYAHIGNLRTYVFEDLLRRTIARAGFALTHVMNITDVGHLQSDADEGEDKMALASAREQKSPWDIAKFYEEAFFADCRRLGILKPHIVCRATDHIPEMIGMVETLEQKGYAYKSGGNQPNVYFDTAKFPHYRDLARMPEAQDLQGRVEADDNKRNPTDFVLWFTLHGSKYPNQIMKWPSPWGEGFPGWHIECSAMATKYLGEYIDIHCGGIDHIPVHHTNEIAQSEGCFDHQWVNYWLHGEFLLLDNDKMSKSKDGFLTLQKVLDAGYTAMHYRYLCLTAHYRGQLKFSWDSLDGARTSYDTLCHKADEWRAAYPAAAQPGAAAKAVVQKIDAAMQDDLNSPIALSALWEAMRDEALPVPDKLAILDAADSALGLGGVTLDKPQLTKEQEDLLALRDTARRERNWAEADRLRAVLLETGLMLKDRPEGTQWYQKL